MARTCKVNRREHNNKSGTQSMRQENWMRKTIEVGIARFMKLIQRYVPRIIIFHRIIV
jgi:hypothetical protein